MTDMQFTMERFLALEERVKDIKESLLALDDRARYLLDENMNHSSRRQNANSRITNAFGKIGEIDARVKKLEEAPSKVASNLTSAMLYLTRAVQAMRVAIDGEDGYEERSQNVGDTLTYKMGQQHMKECALLLLRSKGYWAAAEAVGEL